jgi:chaperonin GroES
MPRRKPLAALLFPTRQRKAARGQSRRHRTRWGDESGKLIPIEVKVGDRVLFGKWAGTEVKIDGVEYLIMKQSDIIGVIEQSAHKKAARGLSRQA